MRDAGSRMPDAGFRIGDVGCRIEFRGTSGTELASPPFMARKPRDIQERAFKFGCDVIEFCDAVRDGRATTRHLLSQLFKAAMSIGSNLEEASAGQSKADFIAKAAISLREARESYFWLRVIRAKRTNLAAAAEPLLEEADRLVAILTAILRNARGNPGRG
jgi:four helix bundle protein